MIGPDANNRRSLHRRAFSMVEVMMSCVIVAIMLTAALTTVGAGKLGKRKNADASLGQLLAQQLMEEIVSQYYEEPDRTPRFGREGMSEGYDSRSDWDDVDDYDGWYASPPENKDGTVMSGVDGWGRAVGVARVLPTDLNTVLSMETGVKKITVMVTHNGMKVASVVAVRPSAGAGSTPDVGGGMK